MAVEERLVFVDIELAPVGRRRAILQIAAVAMSHQATIVTRNLVDFGQIAGLDIEDWSI